MRTAQPQRLARFPVTAIRGRLSRAPATSWMWWSKAPAPTWPRGSVAVAAAPRATLAAAVARPPPEPPAKLSRSPLTPTGPSASRACHQMCCYRPAGRAIRCTVIGQPHYARNGGGRSLLSGGCQVRGLSGAGGGVGCNTTGLLQCCHESQSYI